MGRFDYIYYQGKQYQTKHTPAQSLASYEIKEDGTLWLIDVAPFATEFALPIFLSNFTGQIVFYDNIPEWVKGDVSFVKGKLIHIEETKDDCEIDDGIEDDCEIDDGIEDEDSQKIIKTVLGKIIKEVQFDEENNRLIFFFTDKTNMWLYDSLGGDDYSCCDEDRYMTTDDDLTYYKGAELLNIELKKGTSTDEDDCHIHEIQFLEIITSKGSFQMVNHTVHNGYYGGFSLRACHIAN